MDFLSNNNNKTLVNNNTKLLRWPIFLYIHYIRCCVYIMRHLWCVHRWMPAFGSHWVNVKDRCTLHPLWTKNCNVA